MFFLKLKYNYNGDKNMFKIAVKEALNFIRPLATGYYYFDKKIINGLSTLIILNEQGDILTTESIASLFKLQDDLRETYQEILNELKNLKGRKLEKTLDKYGIKNNTLIDALNIIIDIAENPGKVNIIKHEYLNLAIIKFSNPEKVLIQKFPKFNSSYEIGESTCTLGFAFPEYSAFTYDNDKEILISNFKIMNFPAFPVSSIITRNIFDAKENISMFELSSPIEHGMEGSPILNTKGEILGIAIGNKKAGYQTLSYGINTSEITKFLKENNIKYEEVKNEKQSWKHNNY